MCTLLVAVDVWPDRRLVVAANRDELRARPSLPPAPAVSVSGVRYVAPRDLTAGGTWIGLNEHGVFVGITNRSIRGGPSFIAPRRSRGSLVLDALGARSAADALTVAHAWAGDAHNPFHLVVVDGEDAGLVWSDGARSHRLTLERGRIHVVTERSLGAAPSRREEHLAGTLPRLAEGPEPDLDGWSRVLGWRDVSADRSVAHAGFDDVSVDVPSIGYGTLTSTWVRLGDRAELAFADGPPERSPLVPVPLPWLSPS